MVFLSADSAKYERRLGFYPPTVHLKQRVGEKIDRTARRLGIDHQIAAFGQLETIGRIMTEVVVGQLGILPRFTDVHWHPASISKKFGPAMVALNRALILVGRNCSTDRKTRRYADAARQGNEVGVEIATVSGACVARVHGVAAAPAGA